MAKTKRGFTFVEVLITVVIVALMAAMVIPRFVGQQERAIVGEAVKVLSDIRRAEISYYIENSAYTGTISDLDMATPSQINFLYFFEPFVGRAVAIRQPGGLGCPKSGSDPYGGCSIYLCMNGTWLGDHPFKPAN